MRMPDVVEADVRERQRVAREEVGSRDHLERQREHVARSVRSRDALQ
jgi:hypothetical protein